MLVVTNRIPVSDGHESEFVDLFEEQTDHIHRVPGCERVELLSPVEADGYVIQAYWNSREAFEQWRNSEAFQRAHDALPDEVFDGQNKLEIYNRTVTIETER